MIIDFLCCCCCLFFFGDHKSIRNRRKKTTLMWISPEHSPHKKYKDGNSLNLSEYNNIDTEIN
jgi:hypothetical protein